jgi:NitT/TauT family transport system substrate-binding protein
MCRLLREEKMRRLLGSFISLAVLCTASAAHAQDKLKLAVGQRGVWETSVSEIGQDAGIFKKHGLSLEIVYTQGTGETQQVVISGAADIGISVGTFGAMGAFAKGAPVRVIGSTMTGGNDLLWYVLGNSPIKTMSDTAGKTVAYSTDPRPSRRCSPSASISGLI